MPLREIIEQHPAWMGMACVAWFAVIIWVVALIGWMIQGEVDFLFGAIGCCVAVALGYFSFNPPTETMRPFIALSIVVTVIAFPFVRRALNQRALVAIDVEAMEDAYEMLKMKPDNHPMRFKLAKLLHDRGQIAPAIAVAGEALKGMPENLFTDEHRMAGRWRRQNPQIDLSQTIACINCGHHNPPSKIDCEQCGQPYLLEMARGRWVGRDFARKLIAAWIVGILALAGIPLAAALPPTAAIVLILVIMVGAVVLLWSAFGAIGKAA